MQHSFFDELRELDTDEVITAADMSDIKPFESTNNDEILALFKREFAL